MQTNLQDVVDSAKYKTNNEERKKRKATYQKSKMTYKNRKLSTTHVNTRKKEFRISTYNDENM